MDQVCFRPGNAVKGPLVASEAEPGGRALTPLQSVLLLTANAQLPWTEAPRKPRHPPQGRQMRSPPLTGTEGHRPGCAVSTSADQEAGIF